MSVKYRSFNSSSTALWWFGPGVKHNCLFNKLICIILWILLGNCSKVHFILSYWCITKIPAKPFNNHCWKMRVIGHIFMIVVHWDQAICLAVLLWQCSLAVNHWNHIRSLASIPVIFSPHTCTSECVPKANRKSTPIFHCLSHHHLMLKKKIHVY